MAVIVVVMAICSWLDSRALPGLQDWSALIEQASHGVNTHHIFVLQTRALPIISENTKFIRKEFIFRPQNPKIHPKGISFISENPKILPKGISFRYENPKIHPKGNPFGSETQKVRNPKIRKSESAKSENPKIWKSGIRNPKIRKWQQQVKSETFCRSSR